MNALGFFCGHGLCLRKLLTLPDLALAYAAEASAQTIPEFTGDRVYLVGSSLGIDGQSLKREIGRIEQSSRQTYFVVALKNTGPGADSTKNFMDRLADTWPDQARERGLNFDVKRVVVIVLGVENRKIVILGGIELQQKFAFRDPYIDRELVRPYFTPIAQKGDGSRRKSGWHDLAA